MEIVTVRELLEALRATPLSVQEMPVVFVAPGREKFVMSGWSPNFRVDRGRLEVEIKPDVQPFNEHD